MEWISVKDRLPEKKGMYIIYAPTPTLRKPLLRSMWFDPELGWGTGREALIPSDIEAITHWMPLPEPPRAKPRWGWHGNHLVTTNDGAHVSAEQLCAALNGTPRELLEFAGMECKCDKKKPFRYICTENFGTGYVVKDADETYYTGVGVCDLLNNCCCKCCSDEAKAQAKPNHHPGFGYSRGGDNSYEIRDAELGCPLSPEYVCDLLNEKLRRGEADSEAAKRGQE